MFKVNNKDTIMNNINKANILQKKPFTGVPFKKTVPKNFVKLIVNDLQ